MTREEYEALNETQRAELVMKVVENMGDTINVLAIGIMKYGTHAASCTDEEICNCGFTELQRLCVDLFQRQAAFDKQDETLN